MFSDDNEESFGSPFISNSKKGNRQLSSHFDDDQPSPDASDLHNSGKKHHYSKVQQDLKKNS